MSTPARAALPAPVDVAALDALARQVQRQLELTAYSARSWVPGSAPAAAPDGAGPVDETTEVLIVGGGHAGLAIAFGLWRAQIRDVLVVDASPAGREGPWRTYARMHTLRTPKHLTGPDLGVPGLTPRAYYEAAYGADAWRAITHIGREVWQDYLGWFRRVLDLPVRNGTTVTLIEPPTEADGPFVVHVVRADGTAARIAARRVVLATGLEGSGGWKTPPLISDALPRDRWAHTAEPIDFAALAGRRVGVLGGGASGFDNAACALEAGAEVELFVRRPALPRVNPYRWMEFHGFVQHYPAWPDERKWRFNHHLDVIDQPPPQETLWRCLDHDRFTVHLGTCWEAVSMAGDGAVQVRTNRGAHRFDFVIAATGIAIDLHLRPELRAVVDRLACWADRFEPPPELASDALGAHPYLGEGFEHTARYAGDEAWARRLHHFAFAAKLSMGVTGHRLSGLTAGVDRLVHHIGRQLFLEHGDHFLDSFLTYDEPELVSLERRPAPPR
ncbi:MAG: NAD(P)-binding domain-containing protein [Acidimicrobiia bacterium]